MKAVIIVQVVLMLAALSVFLPFAASATTVKSVYTGYACSFALDAGGDVWVWGRFRVKTTCILSRCPSSTT